MSSPPPPGRKRRPTSSSDPGSCWASLPEDVLGVVASRLLAGDLLDYVRLRAVCSSWRSGTADPRGRGVADPRFHPRRWMMLPEGHYLYPGHPNLGGFVRFLNLDTGALVRARIPFLGVGDFWPIDSVDGLLLLLRDTVDDVGAVRLLHPFTGDFVEFPPIGTLASRLLDGCPPSLRNRRLTRIVYTSVSFDASGAITIMLALFHVCLIAFATSMDRQWTLSTSHYPVQYPPLPFQGKLYVVHTPQTPWGQEKIHQVLQLDPPITQDDGGRALPQPKLIATIPAGNLVHPKGLVECGSEILVLGHNDKSQSQITIFKLADLVQQRFIPVESIGGNTLFLKERSICVSSKILSTVKGDNVIYLCSGQPCALVQYHLTSGSLSPAVDTCSLYSGNPGPSCLVHYIFSCCIRNGWGRGLIFRIDHPELFP